MGSLCQLGALIKLRTVELPVLNRVLKRSIQNFHLLSEYCQLELLGIMKTRVDALEMKKKRPAGAGEFLAYLEYNLPFLKSEIYLVSEEI